jgi:hypothetical protein
MDANPRWYKGNVHMHSYWSDGHDFPEMVADWFKNNGYHFVAFTEHDQHQVGDRWLRCDPATAPGRSLLDGDLLSKYVDRFGPDWVKLRRADGMTEVRLASLFEYRHLFEEPDRFLILNGEEVTTTWGPKRHAHWIDVLNTAEPLAPQHSDRSSSDAMRLTFEASVLAAAQSNREVLAFLNHPNFRWNATAEDIAAVPDLRHMEMHTALNSCNTYGDALRASAERIWDIALTIRLGELGGQVIYGLATDDCHTYAPHHRLGRTSLPGRAWIVVRAHWLTPQHIVAAINRGDFYASTGVTLRDVQTDTNGMHIQIEPSAGVNYVTRFVGTRRGYDPSSEPVVDEGGYQVSTTRRYSDEIGTTLEEVTGPRPSYEFIGDELYVRAVVVSDVAHHNPTVPGDVQKAWTQPAQPCKRHVTPMVRH